MTEDEEIKAMEAELEWEAFWADSDSGVGSIDFHKMAVSLHAKGWRLPQ